MNMEDTIPLPSETDFVDEYLAYISCTFASIDIDYYKAPMDTSRNAFGKSETSYTSTFNLR